MWVRMSHPSGALDVRFAPSERQACNQSRKSRLRSQDVQAEALGAEFSWGLDDVDWFNDFLAKNLVSNPLEYQYLRKIWSAEKPGKKKVMAFQYGKVASSAIVEGMKAQLGIAVAHAHLPEHARQWMDGERPQIPLQVQGFAFSQEWSLKPGDECFIITATRSHFSRDPSEYFENILLPEHPYGYHPRGVRRYNDTPPVGTDKRWTEAKITELGKSNVAILQEDFQIQHEIVIQAYSKWYSEVFFGATGINILKQKFDRHKKHMLVRAETCQVLVLRFEDISEWSNIIGKYFPGFQMPKGANRAELKWYADAYRNFKSTLEYRPEELKAMCETETETHFYADDPSSECCAESGANAQPTGAPDAFFAFCCENGLTFPVVPRPAESARLSGSAGRDFYQSCTPNTFAAVQQLSAQNDTVKII
ncbi:hypothetical protein AK812_SmicGene3441 [Symbiodinium microadriaticum]|uniref:Uncharacterized protein n=1 Tax=Symbiodinium microadriaticum TaxID=2951 RepID=A0A1Q9EZ22_SYMMI|nr:hypothetical protein AK812_SmicGene3441 [Symbiodinium microadriaticum]CAE7393557.1 unnamed protein product [Symbiodinium sp. KB8]